MSEEYLAQVLKKILMTEKTSRIQAYSQYTFEVLTDATKRDIKRAVEWLFGVHVKKVGIVNSKSRIKKNFRGKISKVKAVKKAYVSLQQGEIIDAEKIQS